MERTFETLKNEIKSCQKCDLCLTRKNTVFGDGIAKTKLLFVGEAPGQMEDEMGLPFVGRSGKLLDKMLAAVDISRTKNMFITNIVKCRPPNNADPTDTQRQACAEYLKQQIDLISPKVIVCVGRIAATSLINPDFRVTKDHGKIYKKGEIDFMGTFHPSALLRFPQNKEEAFKDFLTLKSFLAQLS
ncbi:MAG: uracil-DNA glycosylase [Oscillospiraceae bacterium]|nr:uracil-DNA glycosylase [Oscillospiraceae bacterium]